jgi:hypothetical protein
MLLQAAISVVTLTAIAGSAINILAAGSDELGEGEDKITKSARGFHLKPLTDADVNLSIHLAPFHRMWSASLACGVKQQLPRLSSSPQD